MGASPSMVEKTALVLKDNAGVAMDPALVGQARPVDPGGVVPRPGGRQHRRRPAVRRRQSRRASRRSPTPSSARASSTTPSSDGSSSPASWAATASPQTVEYTEGREHRLPLVRRQRQRRLRRRPRTAPTRASRSRSATACPTATFEISKVVATPQKTDGTKPIKVQAFVQNTSDIAGAEVVQVYVGVPAAAGAAQAARRLREGLARAGPEEARPARDRPGRLQPPVRDLGRHRGRMENPRRPTTGLRRQLLRERRNLYPDDYYPRPQEEVTTPHH